jgi:hypothetical protein
MKSCDFRNLTLEQRRLLDDGGWMADGRKAAPSRPTTQQLVNSGLLEAYTALHEDEHGSYGLTEYYVPLDVRAAWLDFKSRAPQQLESLEEEP